jgi:hypothetical protein
MCWSGQGTMVFIYKQGLLSAWFFVLGRATYTNLIYKIVLKKKQIKPPTPTEETTMSSSSLEHSFWKGLRKKKSLPPFVNSKEQNLGN